MIQNTSIRASVNTVVLYAKLLLSTAIALFNVPLLLRALGVENYGIFCIVGGVISLLMFLNSTMSTATNRFLAVTDGKRGGLAEKQSMFLHCLYIHTLIALILLIGFEVIALFFWDHLLNIAADRTFAAKIVFQTMAVTTFFTVATVPYNGIIIVKERMIFIAVLTFVVSVAKLGITFLLFTVSSDRLIAYAVLLMLIHLLERIAYVGYAHYRANIRYYRLKPDPALLKEMASFFGWNMSINFSLSALYSVTSIFLNRFFGVLVNAAEGIAIQIAGQITGVCNCLQNAVTPIVMKKQGGEQTDRALDITLTSCRMMVYLFLMTGITVFVEMPYLLKIWLKDVPDFAMGFCRLILVRILIDQASVPLEVLMKANGNVMGVQFFSSVVILLTLGLEFMILWCGGVPYSAYFCMIGMMVAVGVVRVLAVKKHYGMRGWDFMRDVVLREAGVALCGMAAAWCLTLLMGASLLRCGLSFVLSVLVVGITVWSFGITGKEREVFRSMFRQVFSKISGKKILQAGADNE